MGSAYPGAGWDMLAPSQGLQALAAEAQAGASQSLLLPLVGLGSGDLLAS